jgi:hypothetical protein
MPAYQGKPKDTTGDPTPSNKKNKGAKGRNTNSSKLRTQQ